MGITIPGRYQMPLPEYVNDPCPLPSVNSGIAHTLLTKSPRHAWYEHPKLNPKYEPDNSSRSDIGTIAHALFLEQDDSRVVVIAAADWRTKGARDQREAAWVEHKLPILETDYQDVHEMVQVCKNAMDESEFAQDFSESLREQTVLWEEAGVWCRTRPDAMTKDARIIWDYKTTDSAHPADFGRTIIRQGYDVQSELQKRGVRKMFNPQRCTHVLIVQEIAPPYAVSFISLSPHWEEIGQDKINFALAVWRGCMKTGHWPGYVNQVSYLDPPSFADRWSENVPTIDAEDL